MPNIIQPSALRSKPFDCTDTGNAERFAYHYGANLRYCTDQGIWYNFDGIRWKKVAEEVLLVAAMKAVRRITEEISLDARRTDELARWSRKSESKERLAAMIGLSRALLSVKREVFDQDPYLLNCKNGTLNLRTGELRVHNSCDWITKLIQVEYDANAQCPRFLKLLDEVFKPNPEVKAFLQRVGDILYPAA